MDNAFIVDGVLAAVLAVGALIGAKRGLFKSLMGLIVVIAALVGAVVLADLLTDPITDAVAPRIEDAVVRHFSEELEKALESGDTDAQGGMSEMLERYGVSGDVLEPLINSFASGVFGAIATAKDAAAETFRGAASTGIRALVRGVVHTVLMLVFYVVLLIVLKLLTRTVDHVFDLPLLSTVNGFGGAALGLAEAAMLTYVAVHILAHFGVSTIADHADDTRLLPIFLNHSPIEWISALTHQK